MGSAIRGALSLGLHLRNEGSCTSDVSKEIRYRVWWSLYSVEHLLTAMTGRPSCIADNFCTTPLPVPYDENDFQKEEVARLISSPYRGSRSSLEYAKMQPATPVLKASDPEASDVPAGSKVAGMGHNEYLKGLSPCMSLYFIQLATLTSISKRVMSKLYSPETALFPWPTIEFTIQNLMLEIDSWLMDLPAAYDFTSTQTSQCPTSQRMSLALYFYSTKLGITKPCLCRPDSTCFQNDKTSEFCNNMGAECVEAACHMLTLLPDTPDSVLLTKLSPWWCILHFLMQSTTVLLLELAFKTQHVPDKESMVCKAAKKAVEWLFFLSKESSAAERAWKLCDRSLRQLAPRIGIDVSDLPNNDENISNEGNVTTPMTPAVATTETATAKAPVAATTSEIDDPIVVKTPPDIPPEVAFDLPTPPPATGMPSDAFAADDPTPANLDLIQYSPMDDRPGTSLAMPLTYGLDPTDTLEFLKNEKQFTVGSPYAEYFPYDPVAGEISGPLFPTGTNNMDIDFGGYLWYDSIF